MSTSLLPLTPVPEPGLQPLGPINSVTAPGARPVEPARGLPHHVKRHLVGGTSALGVGTVIERGAGFLANILAARFAGTSVFGSYALAISTANNISTYAAGGIGATAARFSGKYPYGTSGYSTLARALGIVSLISAALAAIGLWFGAGPIAHLLGKQALTSLLRWAALSAAGIIVLECARGFFVGQRRLFAVMLLSLLVGVGMLTLLPIAARQHSPTRMVVVQGCITVAAVLVCLLFGRPLGLHAPSHVNGRPLAPMLREVWTFGGVQLAGLIGSNVAGWWLMTLVARGDSTLVQMSFFAIASQWRNLVGLAPSLITEGSYAVMADPDGETSSTPHRVMALCSYGSLGISLAVAAVGMLVAPWAIALLYGHSYASAAFTVTLALAIAVVHMGNAPAAARLTIVSIRATGIINTVWAVVVAIAATLLLFHGGAAWQAMAIYFAAHALSSALVLLTLHRKDHVPAGMTALFFTGLTGSASLAALAWLRAIRPAHQLAITGLMFAVVLLFAAAFVALGRAHRWIPSANAVSGLVASLRSRLPGGPR